MKNIRLFMLLLMMGWVIFTGCNQTREEAFEPANYVNMKIGVERGHTFVTAVNPFGMISPGPHYNRHTGNKLSMDSTIGFSHVHASGVGCGDQWGSILVMPLAGESTTEPSEMISAIENEKATPGYYSAKLSKDDIRARITATTRCAVHQYIFSSNNANIIIDLSKHLNKRYDSSFLAVTSPAEVQGYVSEGAFCSSTTEKHKIYFYAKLDKPAKNYGVINNNTVLTEKQIKDKEIGGWFSYDLEENDTIELRLAISYVSVDNARMNMQRELQDKSFQTIKDESWEAWNNKLSKIEVEGCEKNKVLFYTALYHILLHPNVYNDVNGEYLSYSHYPAKGKREVKEAKGYTYYALYSLWDTYRTLHPFLTLFYPDYQSDMVRSMLNKYEEKGWFPKWEHANVETYNMCGAPAVPVITDSYMKGIRDFDTSLAYEAIYKDATYPDTASKERNRPGLEQYIEYGGYIPQDYVMIKPPVWGPVSTTLEYNLADWCFAQFCREIGEDDQYEKFIERSKGYKNLYHPEYKMLVPKAKDGKWYKPFDPDFFSMFCERCPYVEGTAWNYMFFVPHDIQNLKQMMGGDEEFVKMLKKCFSSGHYHMFNEPDIAYPYLFNYAPGSEWRTQKTVDSLINTHFYIAPDGLPGDDDCGTMSAWLAFSMMGFYPDCPAKTSYQLSSPKFKRVTINLNNDYYEGDQFIIETDRVGDQAIYIRQMFLNGKKYNRFTLDHEALVSGGKMLFKLGKEFQE